MKKITEEMNDMLPTMYPMCIRVKNEIEKCSEIQNAFIKSNLNDIVLSWTGVFLHSVYHVFKDLRYKGNNNWDSSILFCGLSSQTMQWDWIIYCVCYGQYDLVLRELRNVLESAFLFYRADHDDKLRDKKLEEKAEEIEKLNENERYGIKVFRKSGYTSWEYVYNELYKKLCPYTHTAISLEHAKELFESFNGCSEPAYDKEKILECIKYIQEVLIVECNLMESVLKDIYGVEDIEYASIFKGE